MFILLILIISQVFSLEEITFLFPIIHNFDRYDINYINQLSLTFKTWVYPNFQSLCKLAFSFPPFSVFFFSNPSFSHCSLIFSYFLFLPFLRPFLSAHYLPFVTAGCDLSPKSCCNLETKLFHSETVREFGSRVKTIILHDPIQC